LRADVVPLAVLIVPVPFLLDDEATDFLAGAAFFFVAVFLGGVFS
jgi:hypothetical protein